jgi:hypothetical protein
MLAKGAAVGQPHEEGAVGAGGLPRQRDGLILSMMTPAGARTVAILLALGGGACSATVADDGAGDDHEGDAARLGAVTVERVVTLAPSRGVVTHVSARFLRVAGTLDARAAERLVGPVRWTESVDLGGCVQRDGAERRGPAAPANVRIQLLDVGEMILETGVGRVPLAPRAFPDVGGVVSGVVYTSRDGGAELSGATSYLLSASGSSMVEGFQLRVDAPAPLEPIRLGAQRLGAGDVVQRSLEPVVVGWSAGQPAAGDHVFVELSDLDGEAVATRCAFADTGEAVVPASVLRALGPGEIEIVVRRERRVTVRGAGIDETVVDFDFAVASRITMVE